MPKGRKKYYKKKGLSRNEKKQVKALIVKETKETTFANLVTQNLGSYDAYGQVYGRIAIPPGNPYGYQVEFPLIEIPPDTQDLNLTGQRADQSVLITGINTRLRFMMPPNIDAAWISVSCYLNDKFIALENYVVPDQQSMVRLNAAKKAQRIDQRKLWTRHIRMAQSYAQGTYGGNENVGIDGTVNLSTGTVALNQSQTSLLATQKVYRDLNVYHNFKKPMVLEYSDSDPDNWLNKRFQMVFKASFDHEMASPTNDDYVQVIGSICTYYRDT